MEVIKSSNSSKHYFKNHTGVGLGNFDGLHVGHMTLINTLIAESEFDCLKSVVYTFTKHPENLLRKKLATPVIMTHKKKAIYLKDTGLDYLYFEEFDEAYSRLSPEEFAKGILKDRLNIKLAVAGFNYRFGYGGEGDVKVLDKLANKYGFKLIIIPPVKMGNETVSSTMIRTYIAKGDMERVSKLLGRHYSIEGIIENGRKIGSRIGFPTANIHPAQYLVIPHEGVYMTKTLYKGKMYQSITNIGRNPTFERTDNISIETHLLDFTGNMYNEEIEVFFIKKIRNVKKFKSADDLAKQITKDIVSRGRGY
jgi:riboflavin kinase / FMN adenylyltransferase